MQAPFGSDPMEIDNTMAQGSFALFAWVYPRGSGAGQGVVTIGGNGALFDQGVALDISKKMLGI